MTKKLFSIFVALSLIFGLTAAFALESSAAGIVNIYESATAPVIDGAIDSGSYKYICATGDDPTGFLKTWEGCTVDEDMELWACWNGDYLYIAVKVICNDPHVAYMDNTAEHYIFNAHHMMTCMVPGDPYQDDYYGTGENGTWDWTDLYNAGYVWEWTIINPSQDTTSDIADHFNSMSTQQGYEFKVVTANGFDVYEQKIPLSKITNSKSPTGIKADVGSLFGFGFQIGLSDWGTGYTDETYQDYVYFSDYFTGAKSIHGMAYCKLVSDIEKDPNQEQSEAPAPTPIDTPYDIFAQLDGLWTKTDHDGAVINIEFSQGTTVVSGSTSGTWPSATASFPKTVYLAEGTYLVYDFSIDTGATSILLNGTQIQGLISGALDSGSGDLYAGEYVGAISYEDLAEKLGTDENGFVVLNSLQIYSVNGATITFKDLKFDPTYVVADPPEVSEPEESVTDESTPVANESSESDDTSVPADNSDTSVDNDENGGNTGLIIGIVVAVVAVIAIVAVVIVIKKKK